MSAPNIIATADVKTYVSASLTQQIADLLTGIAAAAKAADLATAGGSGNAAYSAALRNVERACVDFQNAVKFLLPA